jgi:hypothetical protein
MFGLMNDQLMLTMPVVKVFSGVRSMSVIHEVCRLTYVLNVIHT